MNREERRRNGLHRAGVEDNEYVFRQLRKRIAEELQKPDLQVKAGSNLELAIGTFAPSELITDFCISDYPFIGSRFVSVTDGHVYIVAGSTRQGTEIMAYRLGFLQSNFTSRGGIGVAITEEGWMGATMILFSLYYADFEFEQGTLHKVNDNVSKRKSYPIKKAKAYWFHLKTRFRTVRICDHLYRAVMLGIKRFSLRLRARQS